MELEQRPEWGLDEWYITVYGTDTCDGSAGGGVLVDTTKVAYASASK